MSAAFAVAYGAFYLLVWREGGADIGQIGGDKGDAALIMLGTFWACQAVSYVTWRLARRGS